MALASIQDRTTEFQSITAATKRFKPGPSGAHQRLLSPSPGPDGQRKPKSQRGEFARRAAAIGKKISETMLRLERLATLAKRKALFDDKPVEIAELQFWIKQNLSSINSEISSLQEYIRAQAPAKKGDESSEHSKNVIVMLQGTLAEVSVSFKDVLETRTKNIQASRARTERFVAGVRPNSPPSMLMAGSAQSASPLYQTPSSTPQPPGSGGETLSLEMPQMNQQQLSLLEEGGQNTYIAARSEAIEAIEKTITELGGIFSQLAQMVSEQSEQIQRIDHEMDDVVMNVEGGQRELLKYWSRVSSNRWLLVKMFGVLIIFFLLWVLVS